MKNSGTIAYQPDPTWKSLYRIGAACFIMAALFAMIQVIIEIIGVGIMRIEVPTTVPGWFALFRSYPLLGLTEFTMFQIPAFIFCVPGFLAIYAVLRPVNKAILAIAMSLAFLGLAIYLSSHTVFSMLSLSGQYASARTDAQKAVYLAAGQAMLSIYEGIGVDIGLFLIMAAIIIISVIMLQSRIFRRATAWAGILAGGVALVYYPVLFFTPQAIFILIAAGVFFILWLILIGRSLYQLGYG